jgi:hypothetical protein
MLFYAGHASKYTSTFRKGQFAKVKELLAEAKMK